MCFLKILGLKLSPISQKTLFLKIKSQNHFNKQIEYLYCVYTVFIQRHEYHDILGMRLSNLVLMFNFLMATIPFLGKWVLSILE